MDQEQAEQLLRSFAGPIATVHGFIETDKLSYERTTNEAVAALNFGVSRAIDGYYPFSFGVGIYFAQIGEWVRRDPGKRERYPWIVCPVHLLRESMQYTQWRFSNIDELRDLTARITEEMDRLAIPFIEKYSHLSGVRGALECANPADWLGLGQDLREAVLAVFQILDGDKIGALARLDNSLEERKDVLPKRWLTIKNTRDRLAASMGFSEDCKP